MSYEPLHHKYRPQTFADLVGQEAIATTLKNAIVTQKIAPAYLFTGPRGTGKTSSARILAKSLNCLSSTAPTTTPCGKCDVCRSIVTGSALDVIEIDAASNTGVDNIREIIERAQFAPLQCRYKVYVIDECLTGDSLVATSEGLIRIDNPEIQGKMVLSYNDLSKIWEYKKVLRWLDRGTKDTLAIKTTNREIRCTSNHLIRTETGWIQAKDLKEGMRILSPVNVNVASLFTNMGQMDESEDLLEDISLKEINTDRNRTILKRSLNKLNLFALSVPVDAENNSTFPIFCKKKEWHLPLENGWQTFINTPYLQWTTNLEKVESVKRASRERVYDIEVEENHNFVANGLLVHNCHMLSQAAFNALLKTLEEPPDRVVFVLATTDPQRVLPTIISRCQRFDYRRIRLEAMVSHLKYIASQENIDISDDAITLVAQIANGGLRDAESLLDQLSLLSGTIEIQKVWDLVGAVPEQDLLVLLQAIRSNNVEAILEQCRYLMNRGREPLIVLQNLASFYLNLLIAKTAPDRQDLVAVTTATWQQLLAESDFWHLNTILQGQQHLKDSEVQIKNTTQPRLWLEVTLLGLLPSAMASKSLLNQDTSASQREIVRENKTKETGDTQLSSQKVDRDTPEEKVVYFNSTTDRTDKEKIQDDSITITKQQFHSFSPQQKPTTPAPQIETNYAISSTQQIDAAAIWQKVLKNLHPPTTQALLMQQCHLISFNDSVAIVGVKSKTLLNAAQGKLANIEAAFEKVCQHKIKVTLQVAAATSTNSQEREREKTSQGQEERKDKEDEEQAIACPGEQKGEIDKQIPNNQQPTTNNQPITNNQQPTTNNQPITNNQQPTTNNQPITNNQQLTPNYSEVEIEKAVESLAKCFKGEVILLEKEYIDRQLNILNEEQHEESETILEEIEERSDESEQSDRAISARPIAAEEKPSAIESSLLKKRINLSQFEDENDIPFVRSVDSQIVEEGLLDFHEVTSQRPQKAIGHNFKFTMIYLK